MRLRYGLQAPPRGMRFGPRGIMPIAPGQNGCHIREPASSHFLKRTLSVWNCFTLGFSVVSPVVGLSVFRTWLPEVSGYLPWRCAWSCKRRQNIASLILEPLLWARNLNEPLSPWVSEACAKGMRQVSRYIRPADKILSGFPGPSTVSRRPASLVLL